MVSANPIALTAQHLDVEGHSKIRGRLDLGHMLDPTSVYMGQNAGFNTTNIINGDTLFRFNTFLGSEAGFLNTTGFQNTAIGSKALYSNLTGEQNTATGEDALFSNISGDENTATGEDALYSNTVGNANTAIGEDALRSSTTASFNTAVGTSALFYDTTGSENTAVGYWAGLALRNGNWNTILGAQAGRDFIIGDNNVFIGQASGLSHASGNNNVFIGRSAGRINSNSNNVFIGDNAGRLQKGSGNVFIGYQAGMLDSSDVSDILIIENSSSYPPLVFGDFSNNKVGINCTNPQEALSVLGNIKATGTVMGNQMACSSDRRYKKGIVGLENTLNNIQDLRPVRYRWQTDCYPEKHFPDQDQIGFIAQEVESLYPELVYTSDDGYKSLDYARLTVILTKALQELDSQFQDQQEQFRKDIQNLELQNERLITQYCSLVERTKKLEMDHPPKLETN
jgi:hypothetical protein